MDSHSLQVIYMEKYYNYFDILSNKLKLNIMVIGPAVVLVKPIFGNKCWVKYGQRMDFVLYTRI